MWFCKNHIISHMQCKDDIAARGHASCKNSILLSVQSGTHKSLGSEGISRVNTSGIIDIFILTDAHIIVYEVRPQAGCKERRLG